MCKYQINLLNDVSNLNSKEGCMKSKYHVNMLKGIEKPDIDKIIDEVRYTEWSHMMHMCTLVSEMSSMFEDERPMFLRIG